MNVVYAVLLTVLVAILAFIFMEYTARWYLRRSKYLALVPNKSIFIEPDKDILPSLEDKILFSTNSIGERGSEPPKGTDFFKVLCCGGSSMQSMFIDQRTSPTGRLEIELKKSPVFEGVNLHVGGIGKSLVDTETLNEMLRHMLPQYERVDAIVLLHGASDLLRWLEMGAPEHGILPKKNINDIFAYHPKMRFAFSSKDLALRKALSRWRTKRPQTFKSAGRKYLESRLMRVNATSIINKVPESGEFLEKFSALFKESLKLALAKSAIVVVAPQSWFEKEQYSEEEISCFWHGGIGNPFYVVVKEFYSPQVFSEIMRKVNGQMENICKEMNVPIVDCQSLVPSSLDYYYDQTHITARGSELIAAEIAKVIAREVQQQRTLLT